MRVQNQQGVQNLANQKVPVHIGELQHHRGVRTAVRAPVHSPHIPAVPCHDALSGAGEVMNLRERRKRCGVNERMNILKLGYQFHTVL